MGKILVDKTSDVPPGEILKVESQGKEILVANENGNYFAIDDTCAHHGASLSEGILEGSTEGVLGIVQHRIVRMTI